MLRITAHAFSVSHGPWPILCGDKMRLTDISTRNLAAPGRGEKFYDDDTPTGFGIRVSEGGARSYVLTHGVQRHREIIGRVGVLGLQEACGEAKRRFCCTRKAKKQATQFHKFCA